MRHDDARRTRGQALVEFAIVLPAVMLIFGAILQFGMIFTSQIGLTNSVREAARYGSVLSVTDSGGASAARTQVLTYLVGQNAQCGTTGLLAVSVHPFVCAATDADPGLGPSSFEAKYCAYPNTTNGNTYSVRLSVTVSYNHPLYLPIISNIIDTLDGGGTPGSFRLTANEQMRVENRPDLKFGDISSLPVC